jgi:hypothetical protein
VSEPTHVSVPCIGGVNRNVDARRIKDTEAYALQNVVLGDGDIIKARNGSELVQRIRAWDNRASFPAFGGANGALPTWQVWAPRLGEQTDYLVYARTGTNVVDDHPVLRVDSSGVVQDWAAFEGNSGYAFPMIRPQAFSMGSTLYIVNGTSVVDSSAAFGYVMAVDYSGNNPVMASVQWDDSQSVDPASFPVWPRVAGLYRNRAVYGDFSNSDNGGSYAGPEYANHILFSDPNLPLTIGEDAILTRALQVGSLEDGRMIALVEVMQTAVGSPAQSALLVLFEFAAYLVTGEPNYSTDTEQDPESIFGSLVVSKFNVSCGCASAETVCRTPRGLIWAGHDQVWLMEEGSVPRPVGKKIRTQLKANDASLRRSWHAAYFEGYYRLAIGEAGQDAAATDTTFELMKEQWWLDLGGEVGNEESVRWFGPMTYSVDGEGTATMVVENRVGGAPRLLGLVRDNATAYDLLLDLHPADPVTTDTVASSGTTTAAIVTSVTTKKYTFEDAATDKIFHGGEVVMKSGTAGTVYLDVQAPGELGTASITTTADGLFNAYGTSLDEASPSYPRLAGKELQFTLTGMGGGTEISQWLVVVEVVPRRPTM